MRLGILIRDIEYRDALVDKLATYDNDIFVNIIDGSGGDISESLILTDFSPEEFDPRILSKLSPRTVFLRVNERAEGEFHTVFKYSSVNDLISELSAAYSEWTGKRLKRDYSARIIAVCSESDAFSYDKCMTLARQIIYKHGGRVIVVGLGYIYDYGCSGTEKMNRFARLMYSINRGRINEYESFTYTDSYGVAALALPQGQNPMAYLEEDELRKLICGLGGCFSTIILDMGTCYRKENIKLIREADSIVYFESGRRITGIEDITGNEAAVKLNRIKLSGESEEAIAIDDCINRIYGMNEDESRKS